MPWRTEPMVLVCHPQHRLAHCERASLAELASQPFVAFQEGLRIREEIDRALEEAGITVDVELEFDNIETIKRAIEIGTGISLLPEPTVAREVNSGLLVKVPLDGAPLVRPLGIIHRRDRKLSETAKKFVKLLQSNGNTEADPAPAEWLTTGVASNGHAAQPPHSKLPVIPE
jgi:DNA-binding transcriptional LysR family regulator